MPPRKDEAAAVPVRKGIRGITRDRVVKDMLDSVESAFKILIVDEAGAKLLNSCMRMHEIMDHGVTLIENLTNKRQPVKSSDAIYLIAPAVPSVDKVVADWSQKTDMYKAPHLFFTSAAPQPILDRITNTPLLPKLKCATDLMIEFAAPEPLAFNCEMGNDLMQLFGSSAVPNAHFTAANRLLSALKAAKESPVVRYQNSEVAKGVAMRLQDLLDGENMGADAKSGTIVVVDRSLDLAAPLLHELSYEAMVQDLAPLQDNVFKMPSRDPKVPAKQIPVDNEDAVWCELRHKHVADVIKACKEKLDKLKQDHPQLANWDPKGGDVSMKAIGDAVRALPQFQQMQTRISVHTELASVVMNRYDAEHLAPVVKLEQKLATGVDENDGKCSQKDLLRDTLATMKEPLGRGVKVRLAMLWAATQGADKIDDIVKAGGLESERQALDAISKYFEPQAKYKVNRERVNKQAEYAESARFVPFVKTVIEGVMNGNLDKNDFPYVKAGAESHSAAATAAAASAGGGGGLGSKPTGKLGGIFGKKDGGSSVAKTGAAGKKAEAQLDLGHGDLIPLYNAARVWIFVIGGVAPNEIRSAYESTRAHNREVIIGGTSFITPEKFSSDLGVVA